MSKHPIHTIQWNYPCNLLGDGSTVFLTTSSEMSILDWTLCRGVMDLHPFILTKFNCKDKMHPKPRNHQFRISNGKCRRCVMSTWPKTNQIKKGFMIYPADGFIIKDPSYSKGSDTSWSSDSRGSEGSSRHGENQNPNPFSMIWRVDVSTRIWRWLGHYQKARMHQKLDFTMSWPNFKQLT